MSNNILEKLVKENDYSFKIQLFKIIKDYELNINELLLLIYFLNQNNPVLDTKLISDITNMPEKDILEAFTTLNAKGLINIDVSKNDKGMVLETINLDNLYKSMISNMNIDYKNKSKNDIFAIFEKEFSRTLSPMEFELINGWLSAGIEEDLIIGALKEATYNGVSNFRYIDKILYEWGKKGFKNMNDVNNHLKKRDSKNSDNNENEVLFDYNWLEDDE